MLPTSRDKSNNNDILIFEECYSGTDLPHSSCRRVALDVIGNLLTTKIAAYEEVPTSFEREKDGRHTKILFE
jgi:hypothetical protein